MKTNELQIGNWVLVGDKPVRVGSITKKKIGYHRGPGENRLCYARAAEVKPIPITEELLLKNGFDNSDFIMGPGCFDLDKGNLELRVTNEIDGNPKGCLLILVYKDGSLIAELDYGKYLHQIQNLCNIAGVEMEWMV